MARFEFEFVSNMRKVFSDAKQLADEFENVSDSLDDLGRDGEKAGDSISDGMKDAARSVDASAEKMYGDISSLEDAAKEAGDGIEDKIDSGADGAESAVERLERSIRDAMDTVSDTTDRAAKSMKDSFDQNSLSKDDIFDANFKAEIQASARETGSEILGQISGALADGSMDMGTLITSISDGLVEIGAEVGGPAGGAMVAGGLIASALWGQVTAAKEAVQEDVSNMFDNIIEQGAAAAEAIQIGANIRELSENQDKLNFSTEKATQLNTDLSTVIRARAGDESAMNDIIAAQDAALADLRSQYEAGSLAGTEYAKKSDDVREATRAITEDFNSERDGIDAAKASTDAYTDSLNALAEKQITAAQSTATSTGKAQELAVTIDGVSQKIRVMPDGKVVKVTDDGTSEMTQQEINNISGTTVDVNAQANQAQWQREAERARNGVYIAPITVEAKFRMKAV